MNNVIYFESSYLQQAYLKEWNTKASLFHYSLEEVDRLTAAIASQYFHFAVFIFDSYTKEKQDLVKNLTAIKQDM
ncbi:MAG: hypothetical protein KDD37_09635, partial [Bdellovibrionales bacterium]|nr:hypothetical protein [Bdellovibrionales bacterium]